MYKDQAKKATESTEFGVGEILLLLSLTMDGLTGAVQVKLHSIQTLRKLINIATLSVR